LNEVNWSNQIVISRFLSRAKFFLRHFTTVKAKRF